MGRGDGTTAPPADIAPATGVGTDCALCPVAADIAYAIPRTPCGSRSRDMRPPPCRPWIPVAVHQHHQRIRQSPKRRTGSTGNMPGDDRAPVHTNGHDGPVEARREPLIRFVRRRERAASLRPLWVAGWPMVASAILPGQWSSLRGSVVRASDGVPAAPRQSHLGKAESSSCPPRLRVPELRLSLQAASRLRARTYCPGPRASSESRHQPQPFSYPRASRYRGARAGFRPRRRPLARL